MAQTRQQDANGIFAGALLHVMQVGSSAPLLVEQTTHDKSPAWFSYVQAEHCQTVLTLCTSALPHISQDVEGGSLIKVHTEHSIAIRSSSVFSLKGQPLIGCKVPRK